MRLETKVNDGRNGDKTAISALRGFPRYLIRSNTFRVSAMKLRILTVPFRIDNIFFSRSSCSIVTNKDDTGRIKGIDNIGIFVEGDCVPLPLLLFRAVRFSGILRTSEVGRSDVPVHEKQIART